MEKLNYFSALIIPFVICMAAFAGLYKGVDIYGSLVCGAKKGAAVMKKILPTLVILLPAIYMFRASGASEGLAKILSPVFSLLGIPSETAPLVLLRPISGGGAMAIAGELMKTHGADSLIGRTAAIMLGSTETTFYVVGVYFSAVGVKKTRYAIFAALIADIAGFAAASLAARILF